MAFNNYFLGNVFAGALAGSALTATAIVIKNNMAAATKGALVGSSIVVAAYYGINKFEVERLQNKTKRLYSHLEEQSADVAAATPN